MKRPPPAERRSSGDTTPLSDTAAGAIRAAAGAAPRRMCLILYHRSGAEFVALPPSEPIVVGREAPADAVIDDASVSRRHASFRIRGGDVEVEDLGSTNGTFVAGRRVDVAVVRPGDDLVLGTVQATVHVLAPAEQGWLGIDGEEQIRSAIATEIVRSKHFGRTFCVVTVRSSPPGVHVRHWCARIQARLRPVDRIGLYSADAMVLLMPELGATEGHDAAARVVAPLAPAGQPASTSLVCGFAVYPDAGTTADKLLDASRVAAFGADAKQPVRAAQLDGSRTWVPDSATGPVLESAAMRAVADTAVRLSRSAIPVLLLGETGVGKEVVARLVHTSGSRRSAPLVCVNCGAIPSQLVESTLFGHERGAFTGAFTQQKGVFESAEGGTVLLDEVGELPPAAQAALLRVLETRRIARVGSVREIEVDVRVLAATHRDLEAMCHAGTFRFDLFYRLNAMIIEIPSLRARRDEIPALARVFLDEAATRMRSNVRAIAPDALEALTTYAWPGNVRELKNAIERAVAIAEDAQIGVVHLPDRVRFASARQAQASAALPKPPSSGRGQAASAAPEDLRAKMRRVEAEILLEALREANWNQSAAARRLKLPIRTLTHKMQLYGIKKLGFGAAR